jgi:uncharacterized membrane protein YqjE
VSVRADKKVKTALDETRLLILGAQILLGFHLNGAFQRGFGDLSPLSKGLQATFFAVMAIVIGLLIAPSLQHRLVEHGETNARILAATTRFAAIALLLFALVLSTDLYVVIAYRFGPATGLAIGGGFGALAVLLWYGAAWLLKKRGKDETSMPHQHTPLDIRIEQMLTEARVLIPGAQALFGFQLAVMLTEAFGDLTQDVKIRSRDRALLHRTRGDPSHGAGRLSPDRLRRREYRNLSPARISAGGDRGAAAGLGYHARPVRRRDAGFREPSARCRRRPRNGNGSPVPMGGSAPSAARPPTIEMATVMIGDTPYDAETARHLDVWPVGVLSGHFPAPALQAAGCREVFSRFRRPLRHALRLRGSRCDFGTSLLSAPPSPVRKSGLLFLLFLLGLGLLLLLHRLLLGRSGRRLWGRRCPSFEAFRSCQILLSHVHQDASHIPVGGRFGQSPAALGVFP